MSSKVLKLVLPIVVLVAGAAAAAFIVSSRKAPPRQEQVQLGPLVDVMAAEVAEVPVTVTGHGEVVPRVAVDLVPQVAGRIVGIHPSLAAGGFFGAGQALVVIEPRDYELALDRARAAVARASVSLQREQAEAEVARQEWQELHPGEGAPSGLAAREPQIRQAEAELAAAEADLAVAALNLERTRVTVPFDGVVVSESVDIGQYVGIGTSLARVYGTDAVEVRIPLGSRQMGWFDVPAAGGRPGAAAEVRASFGGRQHSWQGRVTRMEAEIDQASRMMHAVVEVPRPYDASSERPPLLPGSFVDVSISGRTLRGVVALPRDAMHDGDRVWVFDDGRLRIREVRVLRADREQSLIGGGLAHGELVILSPLDAVTDGMKVRLNRTGTEAGSAPLESQSDGADASGIGPDGGELRSSAIPPPDRRGRAGDGIASGGAA